MTPGDDFVPQYGYQVPPPQPGWHDPALDPLVPPVASGVDTWFNRIVGVFRRSWLPLGLIFVVTFALPDLVFGVAGSVALDPGISDDLLDRPSFLAGLVVFLLGYFVVTTFVNALGWAAAIWAVTEGAVGRPVQLADALRMGLRRSLPMFGWYLGFGVLVGIGLVLCILPGLYVAVAGSLFSFVVMYERGVGPIGRSFSLVNREFGAALGRVLLLILVYLGVSLVVSAPFGVGAPVAPGLSATGTTALQLSGEVVGTLVSVPLDAMLLVGLLITYTQLRARYERVSTAELWEAVNA